MATHPASFYFPLSTENLKTVKGTQHLGYILNQESLKMDLQRDFFKMQLRAKQTTIKSFIRKAIYCSCRIPKCKAGLVYNFSDIDDLYHLKQHRLQHNHTITDMTQTQLIRDFMLKNQKMATKKQLRLALTKEMNVKQSKFYSINANLHVYKERSFSGVLEKYRNMGFTVIAAPQRLLQNELPSVLLMISPKMREYYLQFGQTVNFLVYKDFIADRQILKGAKLNGPVTEHNIDLCLFMGRNNANKLVLFGVAAVNNHQNKNPRTHFKSLFESFFNALNKKRPASIFSSPMQSIQGALARLQYQGFHGYYAPHLIKQYHKGFSKSQSSEYLKKAIYSTEKETYKLAMNGISKNMFNQYESQLIRAFQKVSGRVCRSKIPAVFIGTLLDHKQEEQLESRIKSHNHFQKNILDTIQMVLSVNKNISKQARNIQICQLDYGKYFRHVGLQQVRSELSDKMYELFLKKFSMALEIDASPVNSDLYECRCESENFFIRYGEDGVWVCDCQDIIKTGFPCIHQLSVIIRSNQSLMPYINPRWSVRDTKKLIAQRIEQEEQQQPIYNPGRRSLSRMRSHK